MNCIQDCGSPILFTALIPALKEYKDHQYYTYISSSFKGLIQNCDMLLGILHLSEYLVTIIFDSNYREIKLRKMLFYTILLPLFEYCDISYYIQIFSNIKRNSLTFIQDLVREISYDNSIRRDETVFVLQTFAYSILEKTYNRINEFYLNKLEVLFNPLGTELRKSICLAAKKITRVHFSGVNPTDTDLLSIIKNLSAAAMNCLLIVVAKTQTSEKLYNGFIFTEKFGEFLWEKVIASDELKFDAELVAKTKSFGNKAISYNESRQMKYYMTNRRKYLMSGPLSQIYDNNFLKSSSLSQKTINLDSLSDPNRSQSSQLIEPFSQSIDDSGENAMEVEGNSILDLSNDHGSISGLDDCIISLDMDPINQQSTFPMLIRIINRMSSLFNDTWIENTFAMPVWLSYCKDKLNDRSTDEYYGHTSKKSIRLYFLKLLMQEPIVSIIKPWVNDLYYSILDVITNDLCIGSTSVSLNYFVKDCLLVFNTKWLNILPDASCAVNISRFISYCIENVYHEDTTKCNYNLALIIDCVRNWLGYSHLGHVSHDDSSNIDIQERLALVNSIEISMNNLFAYLEAEHHGTGGQHARPDSRGSVSVRRRLCGLAILKSLLQSHYSIRLIAMSANPKAGAVSSNEQINARLCKEIISSVVFPRKEVYQAACDVAGIVLQQISDSLAKGMSLTNIMMSFQHSIENKIESFYNEGDVDKAISCLLAVTLR